MKRILPLALTFLAAACSSPAEKSGSRAAVRLSTGIVEEKEREDRIEVEGSVVGRVEATISSRLAAPVARVDVVPGTAVRKGEPLLRLDTRESEAALEGAEVALASSRSAFDIAGRNRKRFESLETRGAAAAVEMERARLGEAAARAQVAAAEAAVRRAETDRGQSLLVAPFDAVVVDKFVSVGDLALPGKPLMRLASRSGRRVEVALAEADARNVKRGDVLDAAIGGRTVAVTVAEIAGGADPSTRRVTVRADLPAGFDPPIGSFARVLVAGGMKTSLVMPSAALVKRGGLELVWVVGADGIVSLRYVQTGGEAISGETLVRSGLAAGERVVIDPPADLSAGVKATP